MIDSLNVRHMNTSDNWNLYGSRCVLFRQIFNKFNEERYFDLIKDSEYHIDVKNQASAVNLCRYILLFLNNRQGYDKTNEQKEGNMVPLNNLFSALLTVCNDRDLIVKAIWSMYEMRKKLFWGHLITFDGMLTLNEDVLNQQLDPEDGTATKNAKVEVVLKNGEKQVQFLPKQELIKCLKIEFNYEISNAIKRYIKIMKPGRSDECIVASKENVYLVSCYLACINENIQKSKFTDFTTSICRKTGSKILSSQYKSRKIQHRTQWGKQELLPEGGHK